MNNPTTVTDPTGNSWLGALTFGLADVLGALIPSISHLDQRVDRWFAQNPIVGQIAIAAAVIVVSVATWGAASPVLTPFLASVVTGAAGGAAQGALSAEASDGSIADIFESSAENMAISAAEAGLTYGVAHGINGGSIGQAFFNHDALADGITTRLAEAVIQGGANSLEGGGFQSGFESGLINDAGSFVGTEAFPGTSQTDVALGTVVAGAIGGTASEATGGSFVNGAVSAAFVHLFNAEGGILAAHYNGANGGPPTVGGALELFGGTVVIGTGGIFIGTYAAELYGVYIAFGVAAAPEVEEAADTTMTTVLGSGQDVAQYAGKAGFNVLDMSTVPEAEWARTNAEWLNTAMQRGDNIWLVTDPAAHAQLMQQLGKTSYYLDLELPMLEHFNAAATIKY